ncbi:hypothetical protein [Bradyrhizobium sp. Arg816]|uniref:hypothetical protein n=1 Tax=Bradyrhizobium sp. Arg816 TaxID=2998491 RepID=UPI00249F5BD4|nr:hypothetical protein [Bradyrhizobium sp. Arg816]MDI3559056.1 hypothetical protein [Bradyrhizobium sp. Arg816]
MARYFAVVGGALAALLLIIDWSLPKQPDRIADRANGIERATIRIASARKWPEKVVLDTSQPTLSPPSIDMALVEHLSDEGTRRPAVDAEAGAVAKSTPDARPIAAEHPSVRSKREKSRVVPSLRVARVRRPNELQGPVEACCWFEPMDRQARSRPASRKRVAHRDAWEGWHFPEAD